MCSAKHQPFCLPSTCSHISMVPMPTYLSQLPHYWSSHPPGRLQTKLASVWFSPQRGLCHGPRFLMVVHSDTHGALSYLGYLNFKRIVNPWRHFWKTFDQWKHIQIFYGQNNKSNIKRWNTLGCLDQNMAPNNGRYECLVHPGLRNKRRVSEIDLSRTPECARQAPGVWDRFIPA